MKKIVMAILIILLMTAGLTACGSKEEEVQSTASNEAAVKVITTIFPQYDFTKQIAGEKAEVTKILKAGVESHSYEPTPQDIKAIQNADLFIYVGGENDVWVDDILDSMGDDQPEVLKLLDCVSTVEEEVVEGMEAEAHEHEHAEGETEEHEHEHEEGEAEIDEHVWTSPVNAIEIVTAITAKLCELDQENSALYQENSQKYIKELEGLDASFREIVDNGSRKTLLFGDRFPFRYFADEYGLDYYAAFTGCSTETEASAATVAFLTDKVKEEELPVVFIIELSNGKIAESICEATGAQKLTLYSCHNLTKDEMENGETYLSMMKKNVESLRIALQ